MHALGAADVDLPRPIGFAVPVAAELCRQLELSIASELSDSAAPTEMQFFALVGLPRVPLPSVYVYWVPSASWENGFCIFTVVSSCEHWQKVEVVPSVRVNLVHLDVVQLGLPPQLSECM